VIRGRKVHDGLLALSILSRVDALDAFMNLGLVDDFFTGNLYGET
jgi:hypothetical protein